MEADKTGAEQARAALTAVLPWECWQLFWEMLSKVPVSGDAVDYAATARRVLRAAGADKRGPTP